MIDDIRITETCKQVQLRLFKVITNRRGAALALVQDSYDSISCLKLASFEYLVVDNQYNPTELLQNEIAKTKILAPSLYIDSGVSQDILWLRTRWLGDKSQVFANEGRSEVLLESFLDLLLKAASTLLSFHERGYLHGDIQPSHFLLDPVSLELFLIDLGLTRGLYETPFKYRGALVHYNAPEVCGDILKNGFSTSLSTQSEVYSFGALLFFLYTRESCIPEESQGSFDDCLKAIATGRIRANATPLQWHSKALEVLISRCLQLTPDKRPDGMREVVFELTAITSAHV